MNKSSYAACFYKQDFDIVLIVFVTINLTTLKPSTLKLCDYFFIMFTIFVLTFFKTDLKDIISFMGNDLRLFETIYKVKKGKIFGKT